MSFAAAFVMIAQSTLPVLGNLPPAQQSVTASARIVRPIVVRVYQQQGKSRIEAEADAKPQRSQDAAGTIWLEFN